MNRAQNYFHQIQLVVFFVSSLAVFFGFQYLSNHIDESDAGDYLVSLRENSTIGCLSFYEKNNNILVVGDSHSYAGIDFYKFSQLTGTTKISSCTMGGLYFDSLVELIEKLPSFQSLPANIIFGLSLRQFTTGSDRELQLKEHGKLIGAMGGSAQNSFLKIKKNLEGILRPSTAGTSLIQERQKSLEQWQPIFNLLDPKKVDFVFERLQHSAKDNWQKYMEQLKFLETNDSNIKRFCEVIQKNNINLFLVDLPESPFLKTMYRAQDLQAYDQVIQKLSVCSKKVVRMNSSEWGIDGRFFLNRSLDSKFNFSELYEKLDQTPSERKTLAFDLDHLNIVGAQLITEKIYEQIRGELKYAF